VRDGEEWRGRKEALARAGSVTAAGELTAVIGADGRGRVEFASAVKGALSVHIAVLGGGFASKVTAGENRGETLRQEFVALATAEYPLTAADGVARAEFALPATKITDGERRALAVWVTRRGELVPLPGDGRLARAAVRRAAVGYRKRAVGKNPGAAGLGLGLEIGGEGEEFGSLEARPTKESPMGRPKTWAAGTVTAG